LKKLLKKLILKAFEIISTFNKKTNSVIKFGELEISGLLERLMVV
jgi:hypothetical protein